MNQHDFDMKIGDELRSMNWSNARHRTDLRQRILSQASRPSQVIGLSRPVLLMLLAALLFSASGAVAWRYLWPVRLSGSVDGRPTEFTIPVNDQGEATLTFIGLDGAKQSIIITPDMVDENGVIRDMQWNMAGEQEDGDDDDP